MCRRRRTKEQMVKWPIRLANRIIPLARCIVARAARRTLRRPHKRCLHRGPVKPDQTNQVQSITASIIHHCPGRFVMDKRPRSGEKEQSFVISVRSSLEAIIPLVESMDATRRTAWPITTKDGLLMIMVMTNQTNGNATSHNDSLIGNSMLGRARFCQDCIVLANQLDELILPGRPPIHSFIPVSIVQDSSIKRIIEVFPFFSTTNQPTCTRTLLIILCPFEAKAAATTWRHINKHANAMTPVPNQHSNFSSSF